MGFEYFSLILGCGGRQFNSIVLCSGTYNVIIDFKKHFEQEKLQKIVDFLDFTCGLFDKPIGDWNKITNTLKILYERYGILDDKIWQALHVWLPQHKQCGAFLRLMLNVDVELMLKSNQDILIKPNSLIKGNTL